MDLTYELKDETEIIKLTSLYSFIALNLKFSTAGEGAGGKSLNTDEDDVEADLEFIDDIDDIGEEEEVDIRDIDIGMIGIRDILLLIVLIPLNIVVLFIIIIPDIFTPYLSVTLLREGLRWLLASSRMI